MDSVTLGAAVVGVTEIIKGLVPNDQIRGILTILVAAILGGLAGLAQINGLDIVTGVFVGLAAAGVVKIGKVVSGK